MKQKDKSYQKTTKLILCGLFAAMTGVCSWIAIPLPFTPVPMSLATLAVFLSGTLLGSRYGAVSMMIYVFLGAVGLPVFSNGTGGPGILLGPTGGYLAGYILCAAVSGGLPEKEETSGSAGFQSLKLAFFMTLGLFLCYALGTLYYVLLTGTGVASALALCVLPFLPGDFLKIAAAALLTKRLRKAFNRI